MDVLNMLNNYIKENNSEEELASEFLELINRGTPINKIASQYDIDSLKVKEVLHNSGFKFNTITNRWEKTSETAPIQNSYSQNETEKNRDTNTVKNSDEQKTRPKLSLNIIVDLLNDRVPMDKICKQYEISPTALKNMLIMNGYNYYSFMNRWFKKNKLELCEYLASMLGKNTSLYDLSLQYFSTNKERMLFVNNVESLFKEQQFEFNKVDKKWRRLNQITDKNNKVKTHNTITKVEKEVNINAKENALQSPSSKLGQPIKNGTVKKLTSADLLSIVEDLNQGITLKNICKHYFLSETEIKTFLLNDGFKYYSFINQWLKMDSDTLANMLIYQLNQGIDIKDLPTKYNIDPFVYEESIIEIKKFLKSNGFTYRPLSKKWEKDIQIQQLPIIVDELNKTTSLKKVAKQFQMSDLTLKHLLRNNGYRYYSLLNVWTNKNYKILLNELATDLRKGNITFDQLAQKNIDIFKLEQTLIKERCNYKTEMRKINFEENTQFQKTEETDSLDNTQTNTIENKHPFFSSVFNEEEIASLREIITHWNQQKNEEKTISGQLTEVKVYMSTEILDALTETAEKSGLSRSYTIEKALKMYLKM